MDNSNPESSLKLKKDGITFYNNQEFEKAIDNFLLALNNKNNAEDLTFNLLLNISNCYNKLEQFQNALDYVDKASNIKDTNKTYK